VQLATEPWKSPIPPRPRKQSKTIGGKKYTFKSLKKAGIAGGGGGQYTLELETARGESEDQQTFQQTAYSVEPVLKRRMRKTRATNRTPAADTVTARK
jgi:hypothetical protein